VFLHRIDKFLIKLNNKTKQKQFWQRDLELWRKIPVFRRATVNPVRFKVSLRPLLGASPILPAGILSFPLFKQKTMRINWNVESLKNTTEIVVTRERQGEMMRMVRTNVNESR
jgi:hypothetical protein